MGKLRQTQTTLACSFGNFAVGLLFVWPSYTLQLYTDENTTLLSSPMTELECSLVGSLPALGAMAGSAVVGCIMSIFGRQKTGLVLITPIVISWLMIEYTRSAIVILVARFIAGAGSGAFLVYSPIYISEVADESIRGTLTSAPLGCYSAGVLISYILGWCFSYRYIIWINIASCFIFVALIMTVTESPIFLIRRKREEEARLAIAYYKGASVSSKLVLEEFSRLKQFITPSVELTTVGSDVKGEESEKEKLNTDVPDVEPQKISSFKMLFISPSSRRAFTVVALTLSIQVMMGIVAVQVYAKNIFSEAAPSLSSHFCSVMFALVLCGGCLFTTIFADKFGRKVLLIASSASVAMCLFGMGAIIQTNIAPPWVTAVLILCYCFSFMFGSGSVPYILLAELFSPEVQSIASILCLVWIWLLNFILIAVFPFVVKIFGIHGSFYVFGCFAIADVLVAIIFVPETKGLNIQQIQEALLGRRKK